MINDRWDLILPDWRAEFHEIRPHWEAARLADMCARLEPGDVLYDIGSEQGDLTALYASWGCEVFWFEPVGVACRTTIETLAANNLGATGWQGFVGNTNRAGVAEIGVSAPEPGFAHLDERHDLPVCRLDDREDLPPPDAITIDVEGSELEVIRGAKRVLAEHHPTVWISIHPQFMLDRWDYPASLLHQMMAGLGYESHHLATDHEEHWRFDVLG